MTEVLIIKGRSVGQSIARLSKNIRDLQKNINDAKPSFIDFQRRLTALRDARQTLYLNDVEVNIHIDDGPHQGKPKKFYHHLNDRFNRHKGGIR